MVTSVSINNRQNERPFACFHDMFGKKIHNYLEDNKTVINT